MPIINVSFLQYYTVTATMATSKYEWVIYGAVAERVNNLKGALSQFGL